MNSTSTRRAPVVRHVHIRRVAPPSAQRANRWAELASAAVIFCVIGFFVWGAWTMGHALRATLVTV